PNQRLHVRSPQPAYSLATASRRKTIRRLHNVSRKPPQPSRLIRALDLSPVCTILRASPSSGGLMRPRSLDEFLTKARVPYTTFRHAPAFTAMHAAAISHVPGRSWAKTVVCFADEEVVLAVVPAHYTIDF